MTRFFFKTNGRNRGDTRNVTDAEFDRALAETEKLVIHLEVEPMGEPPRAAWAADDQAVKGLGGRLRFFKFLCEELCL